MPGVCTFRELWLDNSTYAGWLTKDLKSKHSAHCLVCCKSFDISNMGESALRSHMSGQKHKELMQKRSSHTTVSDHFRFLNASSKQPVPTKVIANDDSVPAVVPEVLVSENPSVINAPTSSEIRIKNRVGNFVSKDETLRAEVIWTLKVVNSHYSYNSCSDVKNIFQLMFPDSELAKKFTCGREKCAYLCCFGLAPYFSNLLTDQVNREEAFVLCFDESLNHKTKNKQLDLHVRLWIDNHVTTRYYTSEFMGHAAADHLLDSILKCTSKFSLGKLLQVSMDGPNVNWKFFELFSNRLQLDHQTSLLNLGSCGLHVLHGAFMDGMKATNWNLNKLFSALYWLFKDTPARREDFEKVTSSTVYPLKFCQHRWLENLPVAERALHVWPNICLFIDAVKQKKINDPHTKSFDTIKEMSSDVFLKVKMYNFISTAKLVTPFLTLYQTDRPMIPYLAGDLCNVVRRLMELFIKPNILKEASTIVKILKIDASLTDNHCDYSKINLGFSTENEVKKLIADKKVSAKQAMDLRMECKSGLIKTVSKIQEKTAMKYDLVRSLNCLDPRYFAVNRSASVEKFTRVLRLLVSSKKINPDVCDDCINQFTHFLDFVVATEPSKFKDFNPALESPRLDEMFHEILSTNATYSKLWIVLRQIILLSHGQASVERGFSVNKEVAADNLPEQSFVAMRVINDHIASVGGILKVDIPRQLLMSAAGARQKYMSYLDDKKRSVEEATKTIKEKL